LAARSTIAAKPRFENGAPRSLTKTKGDLGFCSRCNFRSARIAASSVSPQKLYGVPGDSIEPFF
jgi:hypothetical protein